MASSSYPHCPWSFTLSSLLFCLSLIPPFLKQDKRRFEYLNPAAANWDWSGGTVERCRSPLHIFYSCISFFLLICLDGGIRVASPSTPAACLLVIAALAVISTEAGDVLPATSTEPDKTVLKSAAGVLKHQLIAA